MKKWEHCVVTQTYERGHYRANTMNGEQITNWKKGPTIYEFINILGAEGWELVTVIRYVPNMGLDQYTYYFKREKPEAEPTTELSHVS